MDRHGALKLAIEAHDGQVDKGGRPYILHPAAVARRVAPLGLEVEALLHDVVEDTNVTIADLERRGCSKAQVDTVYAMTRQEGETYTTYIDRLLEDLRAPFIKLADHEENLDPRRRVPGLNLESRYLKSTERILQSSQFARGLLPGLDVYRPEWRDDPGLGWLLALTS